MKISNYLCIIFTIIIVNAGAAIEDKPEGAVSAVGPYSPAGPLNNNRRLFRLFSSWVSPLQREVDRLGECYPKKFPGISAISWQGLHELGETYPGFCDLFFGSEADITDIHSFLVRGGRIYDQGKALYERISGQTVPDGAVLQETFAAILIQSFKAPITAREDALAKYWPHIERHRVLKAMAGQNLMWPLGENLRDLVAGLWPQRKNLEPQVTDHQDYIVTEPTWIMGPLRDRVDAFQITMVPYPTDAPMTLADLSWAFMHDVAPVGILMQGETNPAHGGLGAAIFPDHDLFHKGVAEEGRQFKLFVQSMVDKALESNADGNAFLDEAGPILKRRYRAVMVIYKHLFQRMMANHHDKETFNMANVGLFMAMHEYPGFDKDYYGLKDPSEVLRRHLQFIQEGLLAQYKDPDTNRLFQTDPHTGNLVLSDGELFEAALPNLLESLKTQSYWVFKDYVPSGDEEEDRAAHLQILKSKIANVSVVRTEWRINVLITLKNGQEIFSSYPTMKLYDVVNDDNRILLNMAGSNIPKPVYNEDADNNRRILKAHHEAMREGIRKLMTDFGAWADAQMTEGGFFTGYWHQSKTDLEGDHADWYSFYKNKPMDTLVEPGIATIIEKLSVPRWADAPVEDQPFWVKALGSGDQTVHNSGSSPLGMVRSWL